MKLILPFLSLLLLGVSCSSSEEKRARSEAKAERTYDRNMKQAQEDYKTDKKDEAKEMIDESDEVRMNKHEGQIDVDE